MARKLHVLFLFLFLVLSLPYSYGQEVEEIFTHSSDGVVTKLTHYKNPKRPILLLEAGALGLPIEEVALKLYNDGYDVFVGHWRGAAVLPEGLSSFAQNKRNGIEALITEDFPSHLRYVLRYASPVQKLKGINILGHGIGGIMVGGSLSIPSFKNEFSSYIRSISLIDASYGFKKLDIKETLAARALLKILETMKARGIQKIDHHTRFAAFSKELTKQNSFTGKLIMMVFEKMVEKLTAQVSAREISLDILEDLTRASISGTRYIKPELISGFAVQVVHTGLENTISEEQNKTLFENIGSPHKQFLIVKDSSTVEPLLSSDRRIEYFNDVLDYFSDPMMATRSEPIKEFIPQCQSFLTRIIPKIKIPQS